MRKSSENPAAPERYFPEADSGLSADQVERRQQEGLLNHTDTSVTKSVRRILFENICTLFNLINAVLAAAILAVGAYRDLLFAGVMLCNLAIGIIQELRAKRTVDRLSLLSAAKVRVIRNGAQAEVLPGQIVLDDVICLYRGSQIPADCILLSGTCSVNEALITGESDPQIKNPGDRLTGGSYLISGSCRARADRIGRDSYISELTKGAKYLKKSQSEIMNTLKKIVRIASVVLLPLGVLFFCRQYFLIGNSLNSSVIHTTAALIGMIPEGLILLTSTVLAVSVVRLARRSVLVQDLYCIETLAHVDTLCLDKTGTLTEGKMAAAGLVPLCGVTEAEAAEALARLVGASEDQSGSFSAIAEKYGNRPVSADECLAVYPFSSEVKWSGAHFAAAGSIVLGAPDFLLSSQLPELSKQAAEFSEKYRVLLLCRTDQMLTAGKIPEASCLTPLAFVLLVDPLRETAKDTLRYFDEQDVDIRIISGDSPATVQSVAAAAGVRGTSLLDASQITDAELARTAPDYTLFARVSPTQKRIIILSLKAAGKSVAMTGDGVNDVLALKEADCSIAMASGTEAARTVSQLVLLRSDFAALPDVVREGRRSINNLERSGALFLVKNIYSALLSLLFLCLPWSYPFRPIQLTLINAVTIGIPSVLLALEPNHNRISGAFFRNIMKKALPGGLTVVCSLSLLFGLYHTFLLPDNQRTTAAVLVTGIAGLVILFDLCRPFNLFRKILYAALCGTFFCGVFLFARAFFLSPMSWRTGLFTAVVCATAIVIFILLSRLTDVILKRRRKKRHA